MANIKARKNKVVVILGPTASGKTSLAVKLAAQFNGEIVSADSRQVYRGLDIGSGKDLGSYQLSVNSKQSIKKSQSSKLESVMSIEGQIPDSIFQIPYHLIDVADPEEIFDLAHYQLLAYEAIDDILARGKLPIVVGGSGLYLQAIVDNYQLPNSQPDWLARKKLDSLSLADVQNKLKAINQSFFDKLNNSEQNNKRRLIRYIEVMSHNTQHITNNSVNKKLKIKNSRLIGGSPASRQNYDFLLLGLSIPIDTLKERIAKRLLERLEQEDMVGEVRRLHEESVSWERLESFGLEYKFISQYLQGKIDYETMVAKLKTAIGQFAKRQITWFKRWQKQGRAINWLDDYDQAKSAVSKFME